MDQCDALRAKYAPVLFVSKDTPPTFIYHTFNDETVPVEQSLRFYEALVKAGVPSEIPRLCRTARTAAAWARAIRRSTSGRGCWRPGCARKGC